jgi:hypothetical protein
VVLVAGAGRLDASPEEAARLRTEGESHARARRYEDAIRAFKSAEREEPRAEHDCFVALAYRRLERWGQAELFLSRCRLRAGVGGVLPTWTVDLDKEIAEGLTRTGHARVTITVEPAEAEAAALLTASSFAPDERFAPGVIHLAPGKHIIEGTSPGHPTASQTVSVEGAGELAVVVRLVEPAPVTAPVATEELAAPVPTVTATPAEPRRRQRTLTWIALGVGGASLAVGGAFHYFAVQTQTLLQDATDDNDPSRWDAHENRFDAQRASAYVCYGIGAASLAFGAYFYFFDREAEQPIRVSGAADGDGGMVFVEWQR